MPKPTVTNIALGKCHITTPPITTEYSAAHQQQTLNAFSDPFHAATAEAANMRPSKINNWENPSFHISSLVKDMPDGISILGANENPAINIAIIKRNVSFFVLILLISF